MRRYFNTEGQCDPEIHYMVKLDERVDRIKLFSIDTGKYFIINKARQYGKTTTLYALEEYLKRDYVIVSMDFQGISTSEYQNECVFIKAFKRMFIEALEENELKPKELKAAVESLKDTEQSTLSELFYFLSEICKSSLQPVVMMIDEVDTVSDNQVFIDFLAMLRRDYIKRRKKTVFHSVVLASVYDIKNLRLKFRPDEEHRYNSPWNIAADFDIEMAFSVKQIENMLLEYETDNQTGMDATEVAKEIYQYTSGYPYLVSAICKTMDEKLTCVDTLENSNNLWNKEGVMEAVKKILQSNIPLFDNMIKQLDTYADLRKMIEDILYQGKQISFSPAEKSINLGLMFGFFKEKKGHVEIANRIFEMYLLNLFIAEESMRSDMFLYGQRGKNQFIKEHRLDMDLVLEKFVMHFTEIYGDNDEKFLETYGRKFFLLYLKPIINGTGNYYIEAQTLDAKRTDVIVDYLGEQFIVELKLWHGNEYNERGEAQLVEYLDYFHQKKGYMLSFNFNKKKKIGVRTVTVKDKIIVEAVV